MSDPNAGNNSATDNDDLEPLAVGPEWLGVGGREEAAARLGRHALEHQDGGVDRDAERVDEEQLLEWVGEGEILAHDADAQRGVERRQIEAVLGGRHPP